MSQLMRSIGVIVFAVALMVGSTACGGLMEKSTLPDGVTPETARVYFIFPGHSVMGYGAGEAYITHETTLVGYITNRQAFHVDVPAGKQLFMAIMSNTAAVEIDAAAGKTYYVRVSSAPNPIPMASPLIMLSPVVPGGENWDERNEWLGSVKFLKYNPEKGASWEKKYLEKNTERVENIRAGKAGCAMISAEQGE